MELKMHKDSLVVACKVNGRVLRENGKEVYLPFGSEYEIYVKNLDSQKRVKVSIDIDGESIGRSIVIGAHEEVTLERFTHSLEAGNRFKFIERTSQIENHRGIKAADGTIHIEYEYEASQPIHPWGGIKPTYNPLGIHTNGITMRGAYSTTDSFSPTGYEVKASTEASVMSLKTNDAGITVPGSKSEQKFSSTYFRGCGQTSHMILTLKGVTKNEEVITQPVEVRRKTVCEICGHVNSGNSNYCSNCGTALTFFTM